MITHFKIKEVLELCTTFEYKQILNHVEEYVKDQAEVQGLPVTFANAYYNPARNEGCVEFGYAIDCDLPLYFQDLDFPIASDYLTIVFF
jgi:hypothetical protein